MSPVLAQSTAMVQTMQVLERRISALEDVLCNLHPESKHKLCIAIENEKERARVFKEQDREMREPLEADRQRHEEMSKSFDKDPFTYGPDGSVRQSPDGKFRCIGFPEARTYQECQKKFLKAKQCKRNPSMC